MVVEKLTREEVLHVAHLARIEVDEKEIEQYSISLKQLMNDIDKIKEVASKTTTILVTPTKHLAKMRQEDEIREVPFAEIEKNVPKTVGKFVEVPVVNSND